MCPKYKEDIRKQKEATIEVTKNIITGEFFARFRINSWALANSYKLGQRIDEKNPRIELMNNMKLEIGVISNQLKNLIEKIKEYEKKINEDEKKIDEDEKKNQN